MELLIKKGNALIQAEEKERKFQKLSYLVVDDISSMRATIKKMLRFLGIKKVFDASSTEKGLEIIKNSKIDFVISDWNMPDLSGIEFLHILRDNPETKEIPFLMISGEVEEKQIIRAAESEIDGYIMKPFYSQTLEDNISSIIKRRETPNPFNSHMRLAELYIESKKYTKAMNECESALDLNPNSARVRELLGRVYLMMGKLIKGEEMLLEAIEINPMFLRSHETLAKHYVAEKKHDKALSLYEKASNISPNNPRRQVSIGQIYLKRNRPDKAAEVFKSAQKHTERANKEAINSEIGEAYLNHGFHHEAISIFQKVLKDNGKDLNAFNKLGIALRKQKRYDEAISEYKKALLVDNQDEILHYNIARAYHESGQIAEAREHIDLCLEIHPTFLEAKEFKLKLKTA